MDHNPLNTQSGILKKTGSDCKRNGLAKGFKYVRKRKSSVLALQCGRSTGSKADPSWASMPR